MKVGAQVMRSARRRSPTYSAIDVAQVDETCVEGAGVGTGKLAGEAQPAGFEGVLTSQAILARPAKSLVFALVL